MPTVETTLQTFSSILLIGPDANQHSAAVALGLDYAQDSEQAFQIIEQKKHYVFVLLFPIKNPTRYNQIFRELRRSHYSFEIVLCGMSLPAESFEGLRIFRISKEVQPEVIRAAVERVQTTRQNRELLELIHEQNKKLLGMSRAMEERIAKRQSYLQKTHLSITETNYRSEAFQRALIAVHKSNSVGEMEKLLTSAISEAFKIQWARIVLGTNRIALDKIQHDRLQIPIHTAELKLQNEVLGSVSFGRKTESFSRGEKEFLTQIADSVALALGRLKILRDTEEIKMQWEATFNSITSPLALINSKHEVIRANGAFINSPIVLKLKNIPLGKNLRMDLSSDSGKVTILDISSQKVPNQNVFVNIYRDVSAQLQIETRLMESAKIAELGTIGSSIAHELNNPLSGIITFIQLIKMDLKGEEHFYTDIIALESAAQKCKEIIQNLLSFSRAADAEFYEKLDLNTVVKRSIQIVELQSRSSEVVVFSDFAHELLPINSNFGMLSQSLMTYLQLAIESARDQQIQPIRLNIKTRRNGKKSEVLVVSPKVAASLQGPELLRRTIAERILADLGASVEYLADTEDQVAVKIAFDVQVFPSEV
jgi:two-component system NtrC family sensor kinase